MVTKKFQFFILLVVGLNLCLVSTYPTFQEYVQKFQKAYTTEEYAKRKLIYDQRIQSFANITEWTPGVNQRTDWTDSQIRGLSGLQELPEAQKNTQNVVLKSARLGAPTSLDWRDRNVITSIKDQGSCGACWTFATCAYAESKLILQNSKYTSSNIDLSEQYLLQCTKYGDCAGGYLEYAFQTGTVIPTQQQYPYRGSSYYGRGICSAEGVRVGYFPRNYYSLSDDQLIDLLQSGPVAISIASTGWVSYTSGVFTCSPSAPIDHAVLLIGYTPNYWIIKNQWGASWGQNGYMRVSRVASSNCKIGTSAFIMYEGSISKWIFLLLALFLIIIY